MEGVREVEINGESGAPARRGWERGRGGNGAGVMPWRKQGDETREAKEQRGGAYAACSLTSDLNRVRGEMGLSVRCYCAS